MLPPSRATPGIARRFVRDVLEAADAELVIIETVELLTSELVTNVVIHVGAGSELAITADTGAVRVEVTDPDAHLLEVGLLPADATHGRGLVIVDALADAWGVEPTADKGKTVWFELRTAKREGEVLLSGG